ncbi:hypothetical protein [Actinobacillus seminis]|uniref:hypothetical protein n=1 Tax=Actinobacillus seminis TaxID=722 RepID=UPI001303A9DF|nr:hypothetical protein [Actinobacillus seminis]
MNLDKKLWKTRTLFSPIMYIAGLLLPFSALSAPNEPNFTQIDVHHQTEQL